jgi:2-phosphosulfolactate phosphatase
VEILRLPGNQAGQARGIVIVIDVIRAFTVAAYALAGGAQRLELVRTPEDAFTLRERQSDALLAGEINGRLIPGFHLNNSPARMAVADVRDRILIQRTGAGTQGAVGAVHASHLLVCSLVNARATAEYARRLALSSNRPITLLPTNYSNQPGEIEDEVCADYLTALLQEDRDARSVVEDGLETLRAVGRLTMFRSDDSDFPAEDVPAFTAIDRFDFAMEGKRERYAGVEYVAVVRREVSANPE